MKNFKLIFSTVITAVLMLVSCQQDEVGDRDFYPAPQIFFESAELNVDFTTTLTNPEILIRTRSSQGLTSVSYGYGYTQTVNGVKTDFITPVGEELPGNTTDTVYIRFTPELTTKTQFIDVVSTDSWGSVRRARWNTVLNVGTAPVIVPSPAKLPSNVDASPSYTLTGNIASQNGLKEVVIKIKRQATPIAEVTEEDLTTITSFTNPQSFDYSVNIPNTANIVGVEYAATDLRGLSSTHSQGITLGAKPVIDSDQESLPSDIATLASYTVSGNIVSEVGLYQVEVKALRQAAGESSPTESSLTTITTFADARDYDYSYVIANTTDMVGVKVVATDRRGQATTVSLVSELPLRTMTNFELRGIKNRRSSPGAAFSITTFATYLYRPSTVGDPDISLQTNATYNVMNGALVDFMLWPPDKTRFEFELWSPAAAKNLGGSEYFNTTYDNSSGGLWSRHNTTAFVKIGNVNPASDGNGGFVEPKIDWDNFGYAKLMALQGPATIPANGKLTLTDTGGGLKVGDVIVIYTDTAKLAAAGKRAVICVRALNTPSGHADTDNTDIRLVFDIKAE